MLEGMYLSRRRYFSSRLMRFSKVHAIAVFLMDDQGRLLSSLPMDVFGSLFAVANNRSPNL